MSLPGLRRVAATASISVLTVGLAAGPALAADPPQILTTIRERCVAVFGRTDAQLKLVQKRGGNEIASAETTGTNSYLELCVKPVQVGDTIVLTDTMGLDVLTNTFTIPAMSVVWSPRSNRVVATGPANQFLVINLRPSTAGFSSAGGGTSVRADGDGKASWQPPANQTPFGSDRMEVWWQPEDLSGGLDRVFMRNGLPSAAVVAGSATLRGTGTMGKNVVVRLSRKGKVVASATGKPGGPDATWRATFRTPSGRAVKVKAGDRVNIKGVSGTFRVRTPDLVVDSSGGPGNHGSLTARCAAGSEWAFVRDGANVFTDTTMLGAIALDELSGGPDPLAFGTRVQIACESANGIGQVYTVLAPAVG